MVYVKSLDAFKIYVLWRHYVMINRFISLLRTFVWFNIFDKKFYVSTYLVGAFVQNAD